jgi:flagellar hook-associated protein FlgK
MIRTKLQEAIEVNRKEIQQQTSGMQICLNEIHDRLKKQQEQIDAIYQMVIRRT